MLVIAPQGLGDALEATPLVEALRSAYSQAVIDVAVTRAGPRELFSGLDGWVNGVIYLPFWEKGAGAFVAALLRERRGRRYDAVFLAYPAYRPEYQLLARAFPARRRYAHRYAEPTARNLLWLNSDLVPIEKKHNVLRNMDLLSAAGIPAAAPERYLVPRSWIAGDAARKEHANTVAVHVGTIRHDGLAAKRWPLEKFVHVCRALVSEGRRIALIMGPEEREETLLIKDAVPEAGILEGSLQEVARFLSSCAAVLTNDSGIGHLAAGTGARVVALFGPTPLEYAPYGPTAVALRPSSCPPCFDAATLDMSCKLNLDYACLKRDLGTDLVLTELRRALHG